MKLHQLRYLPRSPSAGSNITAAAQKLHTSQPGVSKQIKLLEDELGFQIFVREGAQFDAHNPCRTTGHRQGPADPPGSAEHFATCRQSCATRAGEAFP